MTSDAASNLPPVATTTTDRLLIIICHLSILVSLGIVVPLIVWLVKKHEHDAVVEHAKEALNFQLSMLIYVLCCLPLMLIGIGALLAILIGLAGIVLAIIAAVKASDGTFYRYPLTLRLVK
jgi:uncharacterized protein